MKQIFITCFYGLLLMASSLFSSEGGFYAGVEGGSNFLNSHDLTKRHCVLETGYEIGVCGGYDWRRGFSLEGGITYSHNGYRLHGTNENADKATFRGHVSIWSFMVNGYSKLPICLYESFFPFFGVGVGMDHTNQKLRIEGHGYKGSYTGFSWQLMGGGNYSFCEDLVFFLEYQFHKTPLRHGQKIQNQSIITGVRKFFPCCF